MTLRRSLLVPPAAQRGAARRAMLWGAVGLAAAGVGAWWGWRRHMPASEPGAGDNADNNDGDRLPANFWAARFADPDGQPFDWAGLQGKPLLLNFWATWCPPCVKEMPELDRFHRTFAPSGWQVVGLAIDGPTQVKDFLAQVRVGLRVVLAGFDGTELARSLGNSAGGLPFTVLIDAQGRIRHRKMGATHFDELAAWARAMAAN